MTTLTEVVRHPVVRERYAILMDAAESAASPQIRNQGTIGGNVSQDTRCWYYRGGWSCYRAGGNICYADTPKSINREHAILDADRCVAVNPSDTAPALIALGASMVIRSANGERVVNAEDYFVGPGTDIMRMNVLQPGELLDGDSPARRLGRRAVLLREGARSPGVGLRAGQRGVGDGRSRRDDPEHARRGRQRCRGAAARLVAVEQRCKGKPRNEATAAVAGEMAIAGRAATAVQRLQSAADAEPGEASDPRGGGMDYFLTWGHSPWGQQILTHVSWNLLWASLFAGIAFFVAHASYMVLSAHRKRGAAETDAMEATRPGPAAADRAPLARRARVPLGDGRLDVHAAPHGVPADRRNQVRVGHVALDGGARADHLDPLSCHSCEFWLDFWSIWVGPKDLPELRAEIHARAWSRRPRTEARQVSARQPPLSPRHRRCRPFGDRDRPVDDGARQDAALHRAIRICSAIRPGDSSTSRTAWPASGWSASSSRTSTSPCGPRSGGSRRR